MPAHLNAYLSFPGTAREAMEFYKSVFGGELTTNTFAEFGMGEDPAEADYIMHSQLIAPSGFLLMGADTPGSSAEGTEQASPAPGQQAFSMSLSGGPEDDAELRGYWEKLVDGGSIAEELATAPWGDSFGMCRDRFGIHWMVNIGGSQS